MGVLIGGKWTDGELSQETNQSGQFQRAASIFRDCITADGSSAFKAEPGRYHLYVAHGCPWAHRTLIYRAIKKLDGLISVAYSIPGLIPKVNPTGIIPKGTPVDLGQAHDRARLAA